jgi:hypothetical protein
VSEKSQPDHRDRAPGTDVYHLTRGIENVRCPLLVEQGGADQVPLVSNARRPYRARVLQRTPPAIGQINGPILDHLD